MAWCLIKSEANKFKQALRSGEIDPTKLADMSSDARYEFFQKYTNADNALQINSLFESKLLLKNQQRGMITWAKRVSGLSSLAKRDMLSRIQRLEKILDPAQEEQFLRSLATTRLGIGVSQAEAKGIAELSKDVTEKKAKANKDGVFKNKDQRLDYGWAVVKLENFVNELKLEAKKVRFRDDQIQAIKNAIGEVPGSAKSMVASLDNSLWGRQGIKTLLDIRTSHIWFKAFMKSWGDIARELRGKTDTIDVIKADIYSRPNAINGKYKAGGYGLNVLSEEAFPSSLPEKIPALGRLYKASESAYNGGALRLRADLADRYIKLAEKHGVNTKSKKESEGIGHLVSSLTGRGSIGKASAIGKELNVLLFSIKFLKSNLDTLTAHRGVFGLGADKKVLANKFARQESAKATMSIITSIASILFVANLLDPDSVEEDPRSTNFGKVKIFGRWTDITGGMASLVVLASRITPTMRNGEWGFWYKSSAGNYTKLGTKYGGLTALDVVESYMEGKLAPVAGVFRDVWKGKDFSGDPVTLEGTLKNLTIPISIKSYMELMEDPNITPTDLVGAMVLDALGASVATYLPNQFDWNNSTGKTLKQFKDKVGQEEFDKANEKFNQEYTQWLEKVIKTDEYKGLSDDGKQTVRSNGKDEFQEQIFDEYNFKYKTKKKTPEEKQEKKTIKDLIKDTISFVQDFELVGKAHAMDADGKIIRRKSTLEQRRKWLDVANKMKEENPAFYAENVGEEGEMSMFGHTITDWDNFDTTTTEEKVKRVIPVTPKEGQENVATTLPLVETALKDQGIKDKKVLAYALATIQHETQNSMSPVIEGHFNDLKYGYEPGFTGKSQARKRGYGGGENYYGRGFIQLTHKENYKRYGDKLGIDLENNPDLATDPETSAKILALYFKNRGVDKLIKEGKIVEARRLINPDSKGKMIARTYDRYLASIN